MSLLPVAVVESWLRRSGADVEPLRWFCSSGGAVVVEQRAWRAGPDSLVVGEQLAASVFHVEDGRVVDCQHFPALAEALSAAHLTPDDEVVAL